MMGIPTDELVSQATRLHAPRTHSVDETALSDAVLREASEVYERLTRAADV